MESFQTQYTSEEHGGIITDVRFRPNSSHLATSSFDRTIKLWNAADVSYLSMMGFTDVIPHIAMLQLCFLCARTDMYFV
jgi:WD40 repeat protein